MYTEYNSQNISNNQNQNHNFDKSLYVEEEKKSNKFFGFLWKILLVIIVLILLFLGLLHFGVISLASSVAPDAIVLNQSEIGIKKGKGYQLVTTILPENASNKQVVYTSSDPSVASVNEVTGYVTGLKDGTAIITAKTLINDKETQCIVNVGNVGIPITGINISERNISLAAGYTYIIKYSVLPPNATEMNITFSSSDSSVATVNSSGIITGVKAGTAVINVNANNGSISEQVNVTVYKKGSTTVVSGESIVADNYPKSVSIPDSKNLSVGASVKLEAIISPDNAIKSVTWLSSNPNVVSVNSDGVINAKSVGSADIIVKTVNNKSATCHVTVGNYSIKVKNIYITTKYTYFYGPGEKKSLFLAYEPVNASNPSVVWSSTDTNVVVVNQNGVITSKNAGSAKVIARTVDGGHEAYVDVEVGGSSSVVPVSRITLDSSTKNVYIGSTLQIVPKFSPESATYKSVTYISSNPSVASVNENGVVSGLSEGQATITVSAKRDNVSASMVVNVKNNPAVSVQLNDTSVTLSRNDTYTLVATVNPSNASNKTVSYTSSNSSIATVNQNGMITGINPGTVTITVTPNGGGSPSTCLVTVK